METLTISYCDSKIVKMILDIFGSPLKKLEFWCASEIDMNYLASTCSNLEQLRFDETGIIIDNSENASSWTQENFLPKLTHFRMDRGNCLGPIWGGLIENKKKLVCLALKCCHIGTNVIFFSFKFCELNYNLLLNLFYLGLWSSRGMEPLAQAVARFRIVRNGPLHWTYDGYGCEAYSAVQ